MTDEDTIQDYDCLMRMQDNDHNRETVEIGDTLNTSGNLKMEVERVLAVNDVLYLFGSMVNAPDGVDGFAATAPRVES